MRASARLAGATMIAGGAQPGLRLLAPYSASDLVATIRARPLPEVRRAIEALRWVIERLEQIVREIEARNEQVQV